MISDEECRERMEFYVLNCDTNPITNEPLIGLQIQDNNGELLPVKLKDLLLNLSVNLPFQPSKYNDLFRCIDCEILIEYAPKLFNGYIDKDDLIEPMFEIAYKVYEYRNSYEATNSYKAGIKNYKLKYGHHKNKGKEARIKSFKNHIQELFIMLGGHYGGYKKGNELKKILIEAYKNPEKYMIDKQNFKYLGTNYIKDALIKLKLKGVDKPTKNSEINSFIKAIEDAW